LSLLVLLLPSLICKSGAQTNTCSGEETDTLYGWKASDVEYLQQHKGEFSNRKMSDWYALMQQKGIEIKDVWTMKTSPFDDSYKQLGGTFIRGLYLYSKPLEDVDNGDKYYEIAIRLNFADNDTTMRGYVFWRSFDPSKPEVEQFVQKTKDLPIREIKIEAKTMKY